MDGFAMLEQDHRAVDRLFDEYEQSEDAATAAQICAELTKHADIEEQVLYPMLREFGDKTSQLSDNAEEAHDTIEQTIGRVELAAPDAVPGLMKTLRSHVVAHVREEETDMFPTMRDLGVDPERLGDALEAARGGATP
jgi:hemerythrin superfamily protein